MPVEVLFPEGRERFELGSSGWARVLGICRRGAKAMDDLFKVHQEASEPQSAPPASTENQTDR